MSFIVPYNEESAYNSNSPDHDLLVEEQHYKAYDDDRDADPFTDDDLDSFQNVQLSAPSRYSDTGKLIPGTDTIIVNDLDYSVTLPVNNTVPTVSSTIKNLLLFRHMRQGDSKKIIQNCNLLIKPGTMTLIIGPPSSGKTTLCKLLADQLTSGKISKGSITLNGRPPRSKQYHRQVAYIQQQDHHIPTLTVRETLYFACRLQRPWPSYSRQECMDTVEEVMQTLGIDHRADTLVGDDILRGISGGEKKRVTIGLELVRPAQSLLVLDEPTTGLDATTSLSIFRCLRKQIDNAMAYSKATTNNEEGEEQKAVEEEEETPLGDDVITHGQDPEADSKTTTKKNKKNKKKRIAKYKGGVPIVASLLQPGQDLVRLFDFIVVLTPGGKTAYYGPTRQFTEYFMHTFQTLNQWKSAHHKLNSPRSDINSEEEFNFSEFPVDKSPYDYVLDVVEQEGDLLAELYNQSPMCSFMKQQIQQELQRLGCAAPQPIDAASLPTSPSPSPSSSLGSSETDSPRSSSAEKKKLIAEDKLIIEEQKLSTYATPPWMQLYMLIMRGLQIYKNLPSPPISRIVVAIIVAAILGSLFWQLDDYQADARSKQGLTFFIACYAGFASLASIPVVFDQRPVYYLQLDRKYYHPIFYFISSVFISMPLTAVEGVAFGTVVYWMTGLNSGAGQFFYFLLIIVVMALTMNSLFQGAAYILPSLSMANIILPMILLSLSLFSGFTISKDRTPDWIEWIYWLSPFRYLMESLNINELYGQTFRCKNSELVPPKGTPGFYNATRICPLNTGEQFLEALDNPTDENYKWYWLIVMLGMLAASMMFAMLAIVCVRYRPSAPRDFLHAEQSKTKRLLKRRKIERRLAGLIKKGGESPADSGANPEGNSVPDMTLKMEDDLLLELDNLSDSSSSSSERSDSMDRMDQYFTGHVKEVATKELIRKAWVSVRPTAKQLPRKMSAVLTFRDIEYTIRIPRKGLPPCIKKDLTIIRGISGMVKPGMLVALMGPSGAGKSTLLDVLANRKTGGNVEGDILINGLKRNNKIFPRYSGYIEQQNLLYASDTVLESVRFSALTRLGDDSLPKGTGLSLDELRLMHVEWVLDVTQLNQQFLRHALVKELSYEQKKRLTVAVELAANPDLIFADEPTSGLDSLAASRLMHILRQISDSGRSIVCTIHQPSEELFNLFDHILLISKKGRMIYYGPTGVGRGKLPGHSDATVVEFFETQGFSYRAGTNPADFVLDCCYPQPGIADPEVYYRESTLWQNMKEEIDQHSLPPNTEDNKVKESSSLMKEVGPSYDSGVELYDISQHEQQQQPIPYKKTYARNIFVQFQQLFYRGWNDWWRRPSSAISLLVRSVMFGIILGVMFSKLDQTQAGASERISLMYFGALFTTIGSMTYLNVLFDSRPVYYRETAAHSYRSLPYLASLFLTSMPWNFMSSMALAIPIFFITGLRDSDWNYVVFYFAMMATMGFVSQLWAQMIGSLSPNAQVGNGLVSVCSILLSLGAGFLISSEQMPDYWVWIYWISYYHYCIEGLTANELSGLPFYCPDNEGAIPINVTRGGVTTVKFYCPVTDGKQMLESVGYKDYIQVDISFMVGLLCVVFLIIWFALAKCRHITR